MGGEAYHKNNDGLFVRRNQTFRVCLTTTTPSTLFGFCLLVFRPADPPQGVGKLPSTNEIQAYANQIRGKSVFFKKATTVWKSNPESATFRLLTDALQLNYCRSSQIVEFLESAEKPKSS